MAGVSIGALRATEAHMDGAWVDAGDYREEWRGLRLKIAHMGNPDYNAFITEGMTKIAQKHKRGSRRWREEIETIQRKACAKFLLRDWEGLVDANGKTIPYSEQQSLEFCSADEWYEVYNLITEVANDQEVFHQENREEAEGNSVSGSGGGSAGETPAPAATPSA